MRQARAVREWNGKIMNLQKDKVLNLGVRKVARLRIPLRRGACRPADREGEVPSCSKTSLCPSDQSGQALQRRAASIIGTAKRTALYSITPPTPLGHTQTQHTGGTWCTSLHGIRFGNADHVPVWREHFGKCVGRERNIVFTIAAIVMSLHTLPTFAQLDSVGIAEYYKEYDVSQFQQFVFHEPTRSAALTTYDLETKKRVLHLFEKDREVFTEVVGEGPLGGVALHGFTKQGHLLFQDKGQTVILDRKHRRTTINLQNYKQLSDGVVCYESGEVANQLVVWNLETDTQTEFVYDQYHVDGSLQDHSRSRSVNTLIINQGGRLSVLQGGKWYYTSEIIPHFGKHLDYHLTGEELVVHDLPNKRFVWFNLYSGEVLDYIDPKLAELYAVSKHDRNLRIFVCKYTNYLICRNLESWIYDAIGQIGYKNLDFQQINHLLNLREAPKLNSYSSVYNLSAGKEVVLNHPRENYGVRINPGNLTQAGFVTFESHNPSEEFLNTFRATRTNLYSLTQDARVDLDSLLPGFHDYYATPDGETIYLVKNKPVLYRYIVKSGLLDSIDVDVRDEFGRASFFLNPDYAALSVPYFDRQTRSTWFHCQRDVIIVDTDGKATNMTESLPGWENGVYRLLDFDDRNNPIIFGYDYHTGQSAMYHCRRGRPIEVVRDDRFHYALRSVDNTVANHVRLPNQLFLGKDYHVFYESSNEFGEAFVVKPINDRMQPYRIRPKANRPFPAMQTKHLAIPYEGGVATAAMYFPPDFDSTKTYPVLVQSYLRKSTLRQLIDHPQGNGGLSTTELPIRQTVFDGYIVVEVDYPLVQTQFFRQPSLQNIVGRYLRTLPYVDGKRMALLGHSKGATVGMGTLLDDDCPFACAILFAGLNFDSYTFHQSGGKHLSLRPFDYHRRAERDSIYQNIIHSKRLIDVDAYHNLGKLSASLLLIHNRKDSNVSFDNSAWVYIRGQFLGKDIRLVEFEGESHVISEAQSQKSLATIVRKYFKEYGIRN